MKAHRLILLLSFFIGVISLIFIILLPQTVKGFQIALAFIGSSFISFVLELPNYLSLRADNFNKLYFSLHNIKANASRLILSINTMFNDQIITDKFYEQIVQEILNFTNNLKAFDSNYYFLKKENTIIFGFICAISNAADNVKISSLKYSVAYWNKKKNINATEHIERNIAPNEMTNELRDILHNLETLIKLIDNHASYIFPKGRYKFWLIDDANLVNSNNNFYTNKK